LRPKSDSPIERETYINQSMAGYMGIGFMAAFAVSGTVVLIARQLHKRLLSDFMKQMEFELRGTHVILSSFS